MGRASRPEAVRAWQEVRLVDRLQQHEDRTLRHLVFQGRDAQRPLGPVRLGDVMPAHRRGDIAAGLDAFQEVQQVGLQVGLVVRRRHAVDARRAILARQSPGLEHPVEVDMLMQRGQRSLGMRPRQIGYPLSFRGQVRGVQVPLPCFSSMALHARRLPSLRRVPVSPVPRLRWYYEAATTSHRDRPSAYGFAFRFRPAPEGSCSPSRALPMSSGRSPGLEPLVRRRSFPAVPRTDANGISQVSW